MAGSTAVVGLNFVGGSFGAVLRIVDGGVDTVAFVFPFSLPVRPSACTDPQPFGPPATVVAGDIVVVDAPVLPTSKDQCRNGAWRAYGVFKNQGDCVSFVATRGKNQPALRTP